MPATNALTLSGFRELARAFEIADPTLSREFRDGLQEAAEPVRVDAEILAVDRIRNVGIPWSRMRVGVTRHSVYVAPKQRGRRLRGRRRPNLAGLLLDEAMTPALESNIPKVEKAVEEVLGTVGRVWEHA